MATDDGLLSAVLSFALNKNKKELCRYGKEKALRRHSWASFLHDSGN
jgi:ribosomal protein L37E